MTIEFPINHLWQSSWFALLAGLLAIVLRKSPPKVRYWIWLSASLKFLVPLVLLVNLWKYSSQTSSASGSFCARRRSNRGAVHTLLLFRGPSACSNGLGGDCNCHRVDSWISDNRIAPMPRLVSHSGCARSRHTHRTPHSNTRVCDDLRDRAGNRRFSAARSGSAGWSAGAPEFPPA